MSGHLSSNMIGGEAEQPQSRPWSRPSPPPPAPTAPAGEGPVVTTVKSYCRSAGVAEAPGGGGDGDGDGNGQQQQQQQRSDLVARFYYAVEIREGPDIGGGQRWYEVASAMEERMHGTLVEEMLDCSQTRGRWRRKRRQRRRRRLGVGAGAGAAEEEEEEEGSEIRIVGVDSAPVDVVMPSVPCAPSENSRKCLGFSGGVTLTYLWEGDIEDESVVELARSHAIDTIRTSMKEGKYDYSTPVAPILRVSFVEDTDVPSGLGMGTSSASEGRTDVWRSGQQPSSRRIRFIVGTAGVLLLGTLFVLLFLHKVMRVRRRRARAKKASNGSKKADPNSPAECDRSADSPTSKLEDSEQTSAMFVDNIRNVWKKSWTSFGPDSCRTQDRSDSWMGCFEIGWSGHLGMSESNHVSYDEVATRPAKNRRSEKKKFSVLSELSISETDSFTVGQYSRKGVDVSGDNSRDVEAVFRQALVDESDASKLDAKGCKPLLEKEMVKQPLYDEISATEQLDGSTFPEHSPRDSNSATDASGSVLYESDFNDDDSEHSGNEVETMDVTSAGMAHPRKGGKSGRRRTFHLT